MAADYSQGMGRNSMVILVVYLTLKFYSVIVHHLWSLLVASPDTFFSSPLSTETPNLSTDSKDIWDPSDLDPSFLCPAQHLPWTLLTLWTEKLLYCYSQSRLSPPPLVSHHPPSGADRSATPCIPGFLVASAAVWDWMASVPMHTCIPHFALKEEIVSQGTSHWLWEGCFPWLLSPACFSWSPD